MEILGIYLPLLREEAKGSSFSYQKRSPTRNLKNCSDIMQAKVAPMIPSPARCSEIPAGKRSISSTLLKQDIEYCADIVPFSLKKVDGLTGKVKPAG
jgi:hypothetical protein